MTREKAIEAMDLLASQGYYVELTAAPPAPGHVLVGTDDGIVYGVSVSSLTFDGIDLMHLCAQANKLDLDVTVGRLSQGQISFSDPDNTPEVVRSPRRHPR